MSDEKKTKPGEIRLNRLLVAMEANRGPQVLPGTALRARLYGVCDATIKKWLRHGWVEQCGDFLVLTRAGYMTYDPSNCGGQKKEAA